MSWLDRFGIHYGTLAAGFLGPVLILVALTQAAWSRPLDEVQASGYLRVFVYENHQPYSFKKNGKLTGINVDIGRRLAEELGVRVRFFVRDADENVDDDLRNNVWKGHYLGGGVADVMMHVPYDKELKLRNNLVVLFGRYFTERMALLVDMAKFDSWPTLAVFVYRPIGVEVDTLADFYLSSPTVAGGRIREKVVRYRDFKAAAEGFVKGEVDGLLGPRVQLESVGASHQGKPDVSQPPLPGLSKTEWDLGLAVKHDSRDLAYALGDVIAKLRKTGELAKIFQQYGATHYAAFPQE